MLPCLGHECTEPGDCRQAVRLSTHFPKTPLLAQERTDGRLPKLRISMTFWGSGRLASRLAKLGTYRTGHGPPHACRQQSPQRVTARHTAVPLPNPCTITLIRNPRHPDWSVWRAL